MRELMFTFLTYEPYEKVCQKEQIYIDAILNSQTINLDPQYHVLFSGFYTLLDEVQPRLKETCIKGYLESMLL